MFLSDLQGNTHTYTDATEHPGSELLYRKSCWGWNSGVETWEERERDMQYFRLKFQAEGIASSNTNMGGSLEY